jgi:hypothetical protein
VRRYGHRPYRFSRPYSAPVSTSVRLSKQIVEGEIAYILWPGSSAPYSALLATDTFVMRDGKIAAQTFAAQLEAE